MSRLVLLNGCLGLLALTVGCSAGGGSSTADAETIKARNDDMSKAGAAKDSAKFVTFFADDATVMMPSEPAIKGMDSIKAVAAPMMQDPNYSLSFTTDKVEVSGILGYTQGGLKATATARTGKPLTDTGKYLAVWKKQQDASWKAIEFIFNSDLPPGSDAEPAKK